MIREFELIDLFYLLSAARWTVLLTLAGFLGGSIIGAAAAVMRLSGSAALRMIAIGYVNLMQGTPVLVLLFVTFFGLTLYGFRVTPWFAATVAFSLYAGAFLGEIWRGALISISRTQWEAGAVLGFGFAQQLRYIIVPQVVRRAIPPTVGFIVQLIKNTSLASVIGFVELTREGQLITASTFQPMTVYMIVALLYFLMCFPLTQWSLSLERRFNNAAR